MTNQANCYPAICLPNCDEAITFYKEAVGAEVKAINYFRDIPQDTDTTDTGLGESMPPNFVVYSEVLILGTTFVMTDSKEKGVTDQNDNFWFNVFLPAEEITSVFNKLAEGGEIVEPLTPQFWASLNGYVTDRFGVQWNLLTRN